MKKSKGIGLANEMPMPSPVKMNREMMEREMRYRAESDLRTIQQADEIKRDSERMKMVKHHAKEQMKVVERMTGKKRR